MKAGELVAVGDQFSERTFRTACKRRRTEAMADGEMPSAPRATAHPEVIHMSENRPWR